MKSKTGLYLSSKEKDIIIKALDLLDQYYDEQESVCRQFKWICHKHLPQGGEGYVANKNVFDIEEKAIKDIRDAKKEARDTIMKIVNTSFF